MPHPGVGMDRPRGHRFLPWATCPCKAEGWELAARSWSRQCCPTGPPRDRGRASGRGADGSGAQPRRRGGRGQRGHRRRTRSRRIHDRVRAGPDRGVAGRARGQSVAVEQAEQRLRAGSYGWCQRCGVPVATERLTALPATVYCITCATQRSRWRTSLDQICAPPPVEPARPPARHRNACMDSGPDAAGRYAGGIPASPSGAGFAFLAVSRRAASVHPER